MAFHVADGSLALVLLALLGAGSRLAAAAAGGDAPASAERAAALVEVCSSGGAVHVAAVGRTLSELTRLGERIRFAAAKGCGRDGPAAPDGAAAAIAGAVGAVDVAVIGLA